MLLLSCSSGLRNTTNLHIFLRCIHQMCDYRCSAYKAVTERSYTSVITTPKLSTFTDTNSVTTVSPQKIV